MPVYYHEIPESVEMTMTPPSAITHWVCEGEFNEKVVGNLARAGTPPTFDHPMGTLYRQDIQIKEVGHKNYTWTVPYGPTNRSVNSYRIEFDVMGGTTHVKAGVHVAIYPPGRPDTHNGLIGVKGDDVEGTDVIIPAMHVIVHYKHEGHYLTDAKVKFLSRQVGAVDTGGIFGWDPYETLFLGAKGSQSIENTEEGTDVIEEVSYHFAMSENISNMILGGVTVVEKRGWDVAWVKWLETPQGGYPAQVAETVNVVRVYPKERNLKTILGIG